MRGRQVCVLQEFSRVHRPRQLTVGSAVHVQPSPVATEPLSATAQPPTLASEPLTSSAQVIFSLHASAITSLHCITLQQPLVA